jgi:nucleoside-diphosphate-sugar epimerase
MTRAVILGCGYVGTAMARYWQSQGLMVTATTTTPTRIAELEAIAPRAVIVQGDDPEALTDVLQDQDVLLVSVGAPRADAYAETYLHTAQTLAQVLPKTPVQQVIYTGSYAVYGDRQGEWVTEETPIAPPDAKGEILAETEQILLSLDGQPVGQTGNPRQVCVFRLGGIYGPGRELIKIFGRAAGTTRPGTGSDISNWIHLEDIVRAIDWGRSHHLQGLYNLVQDEPQTVKTLLDTLMATHGCKPVHWDPAQTSTRPYNARVSNQKLKTTGFTFLHPTLEY